MSFCFICGFMFALLVFNIKDLKDTIKERKEK